MRALEVTGVFLLYCQRPLSIASLWVSSAFPYKGISSAVDMTRATEPHIIRPRCRLLTRLRSDHHAASSMISECMVSCDLAENSPQGLTGLDGNKPYGRAADELQIEHYRTGCGRSIGLYESVYRVFF
jgi:hypothetical protein